MRDKIKNDELQAYVDNTTEFIERYKTHLQSATDEATRGRLSRRLISMNIQKTIALYSVGADKESVETALLDSVKVFEDFFEWMGIEMGHGQYDSMVWMVSLGVLCDIELEDFKRITAIIERDNAKDKLLDFIIKSKQDDWAGDANNYIQAIPYAKTENIETDKDIKQYLDKVWYKGHDEAYWHDFHKNTIANTYFGYWAWEVAAIAKIKGIDDEKLKEQRFYPYDAVHW